MALKKHTKQIRVHLWVMSPLQTEPEAIQKDFADKMAELNYVQSMVFIDTNKILQEVRECADAITIGERIRQVCEKHLPIVLRRLPWHEDTEKYYFDFALKAYIRVENAYGAVLAELRHQRVLEQMERSGHLIMGKLPEQSEPLEYGIMGLDIPTRQFDTADPKACVEALVPRSDGKALCNLLREMRIELAKANHIKFYSAECPSTGPCAGTCEKCDKELEILNEELKHIPMDQRVYPIKEVTGSWRISGIENRYWPLTLHIF